MTVNKAQGLTIKEGVVIHLAGSSRYRPASKHGLPFVAFTRSESFAMTAFKNLPGFDDFEKGKHSPMLHQRQVFEEKLKKLHRLTLAKHSTIVDEAEEHRKWEASRTAQSKKKKREEHSLPCRARYLFIKSETSRTYV